MYKMELTKREKVLLIFLGIIVFGAIYVRFILIPQNTAIAKLQDEYKKKQTLFGVTDKKDERLKLIKEQIEIIDFSIADRKSKISKPLQVPELLAELDSNSQKNNVSIDSVEFLGDSAPIKGTYKGVEGKQETGNIGQNMEGILENIPVLNQTNTEDLQQNGSSEQKKEKKSILKSLTMKFSFSGKYSDCSALIKHYEDNNRLFVASSLEIQGSGDDCKGKVVFDTFSMYDNDSNFLYDVDKGNMRANPFK
jgi:type IV pilus assembly protein PilO